MAIRAAADRMRVHLEQGELFGPGWQLPEGLEYRSAFLTPEEEAVLLAHIRELPLREALYKGYVARRRIASYGSGYDFDSNELEPAGPMPEFLTPYRDRIAAWLEVSPAKLTQTLVSEYRPGTPLGWHRDVPDFELVAGISLGAPCRMRFRPYPPEHGRKDDEFALDLEPRSAYMLRGEVRWRWQHHIPPTRGLRYSITFRTQR